MKIIIDAMSGDNAPHEIIKGAFLALDACDTDIALVGDEEIIKSVCAENGLDIENERIEIIHASDIITMEDQPLSIRSKKDSSMSVGLRSLADGRGDAFVSAGNTGALYAGASLIVLRIKGFRKAAIATVLPLENPVLLIDAGANIVVSEENLEQFASMGSIYMEKIFNIRNPRVGLLNNGTESTKGTDVARNTYELLSRSTDVNFVGNVEAKTLPFDVCDVLVTDGFTGNVLLKTMEGVGSFLLGKLKSLYKKNAITKFSAVIIKNEIDNLKRDFDASEYGGAPLLGISKPVIKAHGNSDANAIKNAVIQAKNYANTGIITEIAKFAIKKAAEKSAAPKTGEDAFDGK